MISKDICMQARLSRDIRFDGQFYTAVLTTGIYCRPTCPARPAKEENVRYYKFPEQAERNGFQPCKRCKPELAIITEHNSAITQALDLIEYQPQLLVAEISTKLNLSERQLQRLFKQHLDMTPLEFILQKRLRVARKTLMNSNLPMTMVAQISGFTSLRSFNEQVKKQYKLTPSQIRGASKCEKADHIVLKLFYQDELNWPLMLNFFRSRVIPGVESVTDTYKRTITLVKGDKKSYGWFEVSMPVINRTESKQRPYLLLKVSLTDYQSLSMVIDKARKLFDLDCHYQVIKQYLGKDPTLSPLFEQFLGLRLPGCWDVFEFSIRAILGQQISVAAATTLAARIANTYADEGLATKIDLPEPLSIFFPDEARLAKADFEHLGITNTRIQTLKTWIAFYQENHALFSANLPADEFEKQLCKIKGIGPWTANYLAMRGLSMPDAFPAADLGLIKALSTPEITIKPKQILQRAENWRPWRAYAAIYLWHSLQTN